VKQDEFAIALSSREGGDAIKEVSLKIKLIFPKHIGHLIILFTPHYDPETIIKTVNFTLKPQKILGLQAPFLIYEGRIITEGIVACCINKEDLKLEEFVIKSSVPQEMESSLRLSFKKLKKTSSYFLSFIPPSINPAVYLNTLKLSLGNILNILGSGYATKYSAANYQIVNNTIHQGLTSFTLEGINISYLRSEGYLPLGRPFTITKATPSRGLIMEINGNPAVNIYQHYLEERFNSFMKHRLFSFYPLGIKKAGELQRINIVECLQDGSLACVGDIKEGDRGYLMLLDSNLLLKELKIKLKFLKEKGSGLIFILNSLARKKILREVAHQELKLIKQTLGEEFKIVGVYSDYSFVADREKGHIDMDTTNLLITFWQ